MKRKHYSLASARNKILESNNDVFTDSSYTFLLLNVFDFVVTLKRQNSQNSQEARGIGICPHELRAIGSKCFYHCQLPLLKKFVFTL